MIDPKVVRAVVDKAPPLTPAQRDRLRAVMGTAKSLPRNAIGCAA
ncbi:hypothetical protein [Rhodococcus sp. NPDC060176]